MEAPVGIKYNAALQFDDKKSLYTFKQDSLEGGPINELKTIEVDEFTTFIIPKITDSIGLQYLHNSENNTFLYRDLGFNYVSGLMENIPWEIHNSVKAVDGFTCFKATTLFRGRSYTAWFTKEIPLPFGPWKLNGLPGLILEAYDDKKEIWFKYKSSEIPSNKFTSIRTPNPAKENKEWISLHDYKALLIRKFNASVDRGNQIMGRSSSGSSMYNSYIEIFE
jgi:GLPGLI family protein